MSETLIRGGTVLAVNGPQRTDVLVARGTIAAVGTDLDAATVIDATDCWVGPGFVDLHVHFREPGQTHKEDIATGSAAAAAGGFTAVIAMPNTTPAIDSAELVRMVRARGHEVGLVDVHVAGCLTAGREGKTLAAIGEMWEAGARMFSDDGDTVEDSDLLAEAMDIIAGLGGVVSQHAIDPGLAEGGHLHDGTVSTSLGLGGIPSLAEETIVARDLDLAARTGVHYHLQHVSAAGSIDLVHTAKQSGATVTAEVTPHHLAFDHTDVAGADTHYKMMPPLRTSVDMAALRRALLDGTVDIVATDHAPHSSEEKARDFRLAPNGVTGLEWSAAVVNTVVGLDIATLFDRMSITPARIGRIADHGLAVAPGNPANLVVFDPATEYLAETTRSRSANAPYLGKRWRGVVRATMLRGRLTHDASGGAV